MATGEQGPVVEAPAAALHTLRRKQSTATEFDHHGMMGASAKSHLSSMNNVVEAVPTSEIRAELNAAGVPLNTDDELTSLSTTFNAWLTSAFYEGGGRADALSWVDLYNFMDDDASGFVTYDEVCTSSTS